ncbi:MAG: hypothetical protein H0V82_03495 [Candidatus Protochlamydia sp.]|nr:hypothetical protein [Candidatus Protochlamydia sp.]
MLIKKGTSISPLEFINLNQELVFFDATQASHIKWVKSLPKETKWIVIKGKPLELEEKENHPVFFDQFGAITKKLGIRCVPARVSQVEKRLRIEEIPLEASL